MYVGEEINDFRCRDWYEMYLKIVNKEKKKIKKYSIEKIYKTLYEVYLEIYYDIKNLWMTLFVIPMDVYFIFRYLMTYKKSKNGPEDCKDFNYSKTSIVYCGDLHSKVYTLFFNKFFNTKPNISINNSNYNDFDKSQSCIKMPENFDIFSQE